jgi:hypothetical protein
MDPYFLSSGDGCCGFAGGSLPFLHPQGMGAKDTEAL